MLMKNVHLFSNHCFRRHRVSPSHRQISSKHRADASMVQDLDSSLDSLIQVIHANPTKCVLVTTGGAVQALSWLLSVPGASNTIIESLTPYARESLVAMLVRKPACPPLFIWVQFSSQASAAHKLTDAHAIDHIHRVMHQRSSAVRTRLSALQKQHTKRQPY